MAQQYYEGTAFNRDGNLVKVCVPTDSGETDLVTPIKLKDVKPGEFIRRKPDSLKTYRRGVYDRSAKKYACDDWDDISREILLKGSTLVYVGFTF